MSYMTLRTAAPSFTPIRKYVTAMVNFSDRYYQNLIIATAKYGTLYCCEDGNVYRNEASAKDRYKTALALRGRCRYCKVENGKEPVSIEEFENMLRAYEDKQALPPKKAEKPDMSLESAAEILESRRKKKASANAKKKED